MRVGDDISVVSAHEYFKHIASQVLFHREHHRIIAYQHPEPVQHTCDRRRRLITVYVLREEGVLKQIFVKDDERPCDDVCMVDHCLLGSVGAVYYVDRRLYDPVENTVRN